MTTSFDRIVGPKADLQELLYISALHQTAVTTRPTGTISSLDIQRFLKSRHSLEISHKLAFDIVRGLGGGGAEASFEIREAIAIRVANRIRQERERENAAQQDHVTKWTSLATRERKRNQKTSGTRPEEDDKDVRLVEEALNPKILYLDLVQTTSIILMPTLARMGQQWQNKEEIQNGSSIAETDDNDLDPKPDDLLELVWQNMCNIIRAKSKSTLHSSSNVLVGNLGSSEDGFEAFPHLRSSTAEEEDNLPPRITPEIVQLLLIENGETERANDPSLIQDMVEMATGGSDDGRFDMAAFVRALTADLQDWEVGCEDRVSTYVSDVCGEPTGDENYMSFLEEQLSTRSVSEWMQTSKSKQTEEDIEKGRGDMEDSQKGSTAFFDAQEEDNSDLITDETDKETADNLQRNNEDVDQEGEKMEETSPLFVVTGESGDVQDEDTVSDSEVRAQISAVKDQVAVTRTSPHGSEQAMANPQAINEKVEDCRRPTEKLASRESSDSQIAQPPPARQQTEIPENQFRSEQPAKLMPSQGDQTQYTAVAAEACEDADSTPKKLEGTKNQKSEGNEMEATVTIKGSAKVIDTVVDAYASAATMVLIWVTYVWHSGTYASLVLNTDFFLAECPEETFGCKLGQTVWTWLIIAMLLTGFGFAVLIPMSYGNHPTKRGPARMLVAAVLVAVVIFVPFFTVRMIVRTDTEVSAAVQEYMDSEIFYWAVYLTTILGGVLILHYLLHFFIGLGRKWDLIEKPTIYRANRKWDLISKFSMTSNVIGTARTKRAATRKVNLLLTNARDMHGPSTVQDGGDALGERASTKGKETIKMQQSDAVFQNYTLRGERTASAGSLIWTWQKLLSGDLFEEEGIWLPSRLLVFQAGQIIFAVFISAALFYIVEVAAEEADKATAELQWHQANSDLYYPPWILDLVPEGQEVRGALIPAASISVVVCFSIIAIYLPSTVRTVLKFRCGQHPSLGAKYFHEARAGADKTHMNTANAIYAMTAAAFLFFFLFGLVIFLFLWDFSKDFALLLLAWVIGLTITTLTKTIVTSMCRKRFFRALYRIFPGRANMSTLALECWFIGLGGGVLVGRVTQFLLASVFWIGRIDEPFLASEVALLGYKFDYIPQYYVTEILVHEAHRHPYLERMGAMYLMRLRYGTFGSQAGGCWRQLFVLTLMPWLMKYRVFHEQRCTESVKDQESEQDIQSDEDKAELATMAQNLLGTGGNVAGIVDKGAKAVGDVGLGAVDMGVNLISRQK